MNPGQKANPEVHQEGRRRAEIRERADRYVVTFFIVYENGDYEQLAGTFKNNYRAALASAQHWVKTGREA